MLPTFILKRRKKNVKNEKKKIWGKFELFHKGMKPLKMKFQCNLMFIIFSYHNFRGLKRANRLAVNINSFLMNLLMKKLRDFREILLFVGSFFGGNPHFKVFKSIACNLLIFISLTRFFLACIRIYVLMLLLFSDPKELKRFFWQ